MSETTKLEEALGYTTADEDVREDDIVTEAAPKEGAEAEPQEAEAKPAESEAEQEGREETPEEQPKSVPHERFHAELQRRKELEAEIEKMRQAKPKSAPDLSHLFRSGDDDKIPDPIDNPQGYQQAIESRFNERLYQQGWQVSQAAASRHFGADVVNGALEAFAEASKQNPLLQQAAKQSPDPVGEIVGWHKQQQEWAMIQEAGGLEAYRAKILEEVQQAAPAPTAQSQSQPAVQQAQPMPSDMATTRNAAPRNGGFSPASLNDLL